MIEPFEEAQVRGGAISYGLSSFGYDVRVADEFKVFTDVYSVVVDPKEFDPRSFVDIQGEHCIIPPNSFALARTLEFFRVPADVLVVCVGKSTYARCFRGDTRVSLVDGTAPTLEEMAARAESGERFWGYAMGAYGRIIVAELDAPRWIGRDALLELRLDHGETIHCTPDHEFIRRDGRLAAADDLRPGDALMPLYRKEVQGYEIVHQPVSGSSCYTYRLADEWNLRHGVYRDEPGTHRHHIDHDKRNNAPPNIRRMPAHDHIRHHFGEAFDPEAHAESIRRGLAKRAEDPGWKARWSDLQRQRAVRFWTEDAYSHARDRVRERHREHWSSEERAKAAERMRQRYRQPEERAYQSERMKRAWSHESEDRRERQREIARNINIRDEITESVVWMALVEAGTVRGGARRLGCDRSLFRRFPDLLAEFKSPRARNHKVAVIRELAGDHDVFCLTVPEAGNFALSSGVFASNCGIICNVTPLEPEWRGHLTLEISNTTPLPAKIYANEGVAQLLFFQGAETPSVTYATRGGKYQDQRGVTLPRT